MARNDPQPALAAAIRQLRGTMTQEELGQRSGITYTWISHLESGRVDPQWSSLKRLAHGLGISVVRLVELAEEFEQKKSPPAS